MNTANTVDIAGLNLLLNELRLPAIKVLWPQFAEQSDKEGWPAARFLAVIAEHEIVERGRRRIERHLVEARLPAGKTFDSFDFETVPMISRAQVTALALERCVQRHGTLRSVSFAPSIDRKPECASRRDRLALRWKRQARARRIFSDKLPSSSLRTSRLYWVLAQE